MSTPQQQRVTKLLSALFDYDQKHISTFSGAVRRANELRYPASLDREMNLSNIRFILDKREPLLAAIPQASEEMLSYMEKDLLSTLQYIGYTTANQSDNPLEYLDPDGRVAGIPTVVQNVLDSRQTAAAQNNSLGAFTITAYNVAHESDFDSGVQMEALGLTGTYDRAFLADVIMQGTGVTSDGTYITINWNIGRPSTPEATTFTVTDGPHGASGRLIEDGVSIAVDPNVIPLGTWVDIEGIGQRRADDTGGAIQGNHIDLYKNTPRQDCLDFGVQTHDVSTID